MKALRRTLSIVLAILMCVSVIWQPGFGTAKAHAQDMKTHCLYFGDYYNGNAPLANVDLWYCITEWTEASENRNWTKVTPDSDGYYVFSYDFEEIVNDQNKILGVKWDTHGTKVSPCNGMADSCESFSDYNNLTQHYGWQHWPAPNGVTYDDYGSYSTATSSWCYGYDPKAELDFYEYNPADWYVMLVKKNSASEAVYPGHFNSYGSLIVPNQGKGTVTINNAQYEYYMERSSVSSNYHNINNYGNWANIAVDVINIIKTEFNDNSGDYLLALYPVDSNGLITNNCGSNFTYPAGCNNGPSYSNPAEANPYPDGLETCFMFNPFTGKITPDENGYVHWDKQWSSQGYKTDGFAFIIRTNVNGIITPVNDSDVTKITSSDGMTFSTKSETVSDDSGNTYMVYYWNTPSTGWYTMSYGGFSKWIEINNGGNSGNNNNPGGNNDGNYKGLQMCYVSNNDGSFWGTPHWDEVSGSQNFVDNSECAFVLRYANGDGTYKYLDYSAFNNGEVIPSLGFNISDTGMTNDYDGNTLHVLKWSVPKNKGIYTLTYAADNTVFTMNITKPEVWFYTDSSATMAIDDEQYVQDTGMYGISFASDKHFWIAVDDNPQWQGATIEITSLKAITEEDWNTSTCEWETVRDVTNSGFATINEIAAKQKYEVNLAEEWPSSITAGQIQLRVEYNVITSDGNSWGGFNNLQINRFMNNSWPEEPTSGLFISNSWQCNENDEYTVNENPFWKSVNMKDSFDYLSGMMFIIKYVDEDGTETILSANDIACSQGAAVTEVATATEIIDGSTTKAYPLLQLSVPEVPECSYSISYRDSVFNIYTTYPEYGFYSTSVVSAEGVLFKGENGCISTVFEKNKTVYCLTDRSMLSENDLIYFTGYTVSYYMDGENTLENVDDLFDIITDKDDDNKFSKIKITCKDEWPEEYADLYYLNFTVFCDVEYSWGKNENSKFMQFINPAYASAGDSRLVFGNIIYSADGNISVENINNNSCWLYYADCETDLILGIEDEIDGICPVGMNDLIIPDGITIVNTGKSVTVEDTEYVVYHMSVTGGSTYYEIVERNSNAKLEVHIESPEVAFYTDNYINFNNIYRYIDVPGEEEGKFPANVTYLSGKPIYAISSAVEGYSYGSIIDSIEAKYWDEDAGDFVSFDISSVCDIKWTQKDVLDQSCNVSAEITFKSEWPALLSSKDITEFQLRVNAKYYNGEGIADTPDSWNCVYVEQFFKGCDASLDDNINMNFIVNMDEILLNDESTKVILDYEIGSYVYSAYEFEEYFKKFDEWGYPVFSFPCELAAAQMNQNIKLSLVYKGNELTSSNVSFVEYAKYIKDSQDSSDDMVSLIEALLNYGAYAQIYFNNNIDNLANDGLYGEGENPIDGIPSETVKAEIERFYAENNVLDVPFADNEMVEFYGASLTCRDRVSFNIYVALKSGYSYSDIRIDGPANITASRVSRSIVKITISEINACDLSKIFNFKIAGTSGGKYVDVNVTPFTYIYEAQDSDNIALVNLTKAIYLYQQAAYTYISNPEQDKWETEIL